MRVGISDFMDISSISSPKLSPDAKRTVFYLHQIVAEENRYQTSLMLMEGSSIRMLSQEAKGNCVWLDSEHLLHSIASKQRGCEFGITNVTSESCHPRFRVPFFAALVGEVRPGLILLRGTVNVTEQRRLKGLTGEALEAEWKHIQADREVCEVFDEYPFWQNGAGVINKDRTGLYLYDLEKETCTCITRELEDVERVACSGACGQIVYSSVRFDTLRPMLAGVYRYDLASGETTCLLEEGRMEIGHMAFVGEELVVTACSHEGKTIAQMLDLYRMDWRTGEMYLLYAGELSMGNAVGTDCRFAESPAFQACGDRVYFIASVEEAAHLMSCDLAGNVETLIGGDNTVEGFSLENGRLVFTALRNMWPQELYELTAGGKICRLTGYNEAYMNTHDVVIPQRLRFFNREGNEIHGMVLPPVGHQAGESCPAILDIHGGPRAIYGEVFYHEMQYWASQGYYVLFCNPTGSLGRGQYFGDVCGKSGQIDYEDIMDFVDEALKAYPDIDPKRLGVTGGSYGGFMTNWIIGHTHRFAAAASQRSTSNNISNEATTGNGQFFTKSCLKAGEERSTELLWDQSPLKYIDNAVTPTLFIHALEDYCCYHVEALQMYTALQRLGVETRLCLFKGENHSLSRTGRPNSRLRRLQEITAWMDIHLKNQEKS